MGPTGQRVHLLNKLRQGSGFDRRKLVDGELSGETDPTIMILSSSRVDWCRMLKRGCTGEGSSPAMVARRRYTEVRQPSSAIGRPYEGR